MDDYAELVKDLRYCVSAEAVCDECKHADELCCEVELMGKAADAIEDLLEKYRRLFESSHN